jgi:folate-dependent phosphoribosylglycinamide formyltransferase PurN
MVDENAGQKRPLRVVMFGSGPSLTPDARRFLCRLEAHPDIALLGAFCQAESQSFWAVFKDLRQRRGILTLPLFSIWMVRSVSPYITRPGAKLELRKCLGRMKDKIHFVVDIHAQDVLDKVRSLSPDLGLIYGSPILKPALFEIPKLGTLGIHHGKLPKYRGNKTMFWAMYHDEAAAGVTIQKVNVGLDTGLIVKEGSVPIGCRSQPAVWRDLETLGLNLYLQAILEVKDGTAQYHPQEGNGGKLYRNPKLSDIIHFWKKQLAKRFRGK